MWSVTLVLALGAEEPKPSTIPKPVGTPATDESKSAPAKAAAIKPSKMAAQIVRLIEAGVSEPVIQSFLQNSTVPVLAPTPDDLIYLRQHDVASDLIVAWIQRSKELRERTFLGQTSPPNGPAPNSRYGAVPPTPSVYEPIASLGVASYSPGYGYPAYGSGYPYVYWWWYSGFPWYGYYLPGFGRHHPDRDRVPATSMAYAPRPVVTGPWSSPYIRPIRYPGPVSSGSIAPGARWTPPPVRGSPYDSHSAAWAGQR